MQNQFTTSSQPTKPALLPVPPRMSRAAARLLETCTFTGGLRKRLESTIKNGFTLLKDGYRLLPFEQGLFSVVKPDGVTSYPVTVTIEPDGTVHADCPCDAYLQLGWCKHAECVCLETEGALAFVAVAIGTDKQPQSRAARATAAAPKMPDVFPAPRAYQPRQTPAEIARMMEADFN